MKNFRLYISANNERYALQSVKTQKHMVQNEEEGCLFWQEISREDLSECIAFYIFGERWLKNYVMQYFSVPQEKQQSLWARMRMADEKEIVPGIYADLTAIAELKHWLSLQGYVRFASHHLRKALLRLAKRTLDEMRHEEEVENFIALLQLFLEIADSFCEEATLFRDEQGTVVIQDELGLDLTTEHWQTNEKTAQGSNEEDVILSVLISLAPKKIKMQRELAQEFPLIIKVFESRVRLCTNIAK